MNLLDRTGEALKRLIISKDSGEPTVPLEKEKHDLIQVEREIVTRLKEAGSKGVQDFEKVDISRFLEAFLSATEDNNYFSKTEVIHLLMSNINPVLQQSLGTRDGLDAKLGLNIAKQGIALDYAELHLRRGTQIPFYQRMHGYNKNQGLYAEDVTFLFTDSLPDEEMVTLHREFLYRRDKMKKPFIWGDEVRLAQVGRAFEIVDTAQPENNKLFELWESVEIEGKKLYAFVCRERVAIHDAPRAKDRTLAKQKKEKLLRAPLQGALAPEIAS